MVGYTQEMSVMHPYGYLQIKDRSKDVILIGREILRSVELETIDYMHQWWKMQQLWIALFHLLVSIFMPVKKLLKKK